MNTIKKTFSIFLIFLLGGCASLSFNNASLERIVNFVKSGTIFVVHNAVINNPQYGPIFSIVNESLKIFTTGFDYSPENLRETITEELEKRGMADYEDFVFNNFSTILNSYNSFYDLNIKGDPFYDEKLVKNFIKGIELGIKEGKKSSKDGEHLYGSNPLENLPPVFFLVE